MLARNTPDVKSRSDLEEIGLERLESHWQSWRKDSEGDDSESEAVLQQLRSLVQAGIPLVRLFSSHSPVVSAALRCCD